jgi:hypothetical protein
LIKRPDSILNDSTDKEINCNNNEFNNETLEKEFQEVFDPAIFLPPHRKFDCKMEIPDTDTPLPKKLKPLGWEKHQILDKYIKDLLLVGHIQESMSPFASGIIIV